jgi:hypothetical protein
MGKFDFKFSLSAASPVEKKHEAKEVKDCHLLLENDLRPH